MTPKLFEQVDHYISDLLANEDEILKKAILSLDIEGLPQHSISANQGKFLQVLMKTCNARRVLELGTLGGYSTIWMARALAEKGKLLTVEFDSKHSAVAQKNIQNAGLSEFVECITGNALNVLEDLILQETEPFDFIFIDVDKPPYAEYFELALKLSRKGSIIVCDNVIREGAVLDAKSMDEKVRGVQRLNQALSKNDKVIATILQTIGTKEHDGMVIAVVK